MKTIRHNIDGTTSVEYAHPRECLEGVIAMLRARTSHRLASAAPHHDQMNAALGLLDAQSIAAIKVAINAERARFASARARAEAAFAAWDGKAETQYAASEAILAALMEEP